MKMKIKPCEASSVVLVPILSQGVKVSSFGNAAYVASRKSIIQEVASNHIRSFTDQRSASEDLLR